MRKVINFDVIFFLVAKYPPLKNDTCDIFRKKNVSKEQKIHPLQRERRQSQKWKTILIKNLTEQKKVDIKRKILLELENIFSTKTKQGELLQNLKNQISSLQSKIIFFTRGIKRKELGSKHFTQYEM